MIRIERVVVVQEDVLLFGWFRGEDDLRLAKWPGTTRETHDDENGGENARSWRRY
jgi:hypothetical protein